jgi:hypothetical protein
MKFRLLLLALAAAALAGLIPDMPAHAGFRLPYYIYRLSVPEVGPLGIVGGQPFLLKKEQAGVWARNREGRREYPWAAKGVGWISRGNGKIEAGNESGFLSYDAEGKDKTVRFSQRSAGPSSTEPHEASQWVLAGGIVQAAEGKLKGWYLDYDPEELKLKDDRGSYIGYRLVLSPKPGRIKHLDFENLGNAVGHK